MRPSATCTSENPGRIHPSHTATESRQRSLTLNTTTSSIAGGEKSYKRRRRKTGDSIERRESRGSTKRNGNARWMRVIPAESRHNSILQAVKPFHRLSRAATRKLRRYNRDVRRRDAAIPRRREREREIPNTPECCISGVLLRHLCALYCVASRPHRSYDRDTIESRVGYYDTAMRAVVLRERSLIQRRRRARSLASPEKIADWCVGVVKHATYTRTRAHTYVSTREHAELSLRNASINKNLRLGRPPRSN